MGFIDFITFNSKPPLPGINERLLRSSDQYDRAWSDDPLFKDLLVCCGQLTKTDMDVARIGSNGYMKRLSYGKVTVRDKRIRSLFETFDVDTGRLDEDGYISDVVWKLMKAAKSAGKKAEPDVREGANQAVYVTSLVLARHILSIHPEYAERIAQIAPVLKEVAK